MPAARTKTTRTPTERKPTFSPTKLNTYLDCALKYRYVYIDKIGRFYLKSKSYYSFGTTLHHVLQEFHGQGGTQSVEEMQTTLGSSWVGAGYETAEQEKEHKEQGEAIVTAYHSAHRERVTAQVETMATEKTLTCDMGAFKLSGRVDRIDKHPDGTLEIIDYKSGRWETTPEEVAGSLAMNVYQLILKKLYPENEVFGTIYCLRSGITASAMLEGEALAEFERDILTLCAEMMNRDDWGEILPVPVDSCQTCDFLPRCSRFWQAKDDFVIDDGRMSDE